MESVLLSMRQKQRALYGLIVRSEFLVALVISLAVIIVGVGLGRENNKVVPVNTVASSHYNLEPNNRLSFMSNWDGPIYLGIAKNGYTNKAEANFFPLYPIVTRLVHSVIPSMLDSALCVSWLSLVGAVYFFIRILKHLFRIKDNIEAARGTLLFVLFPTAVFLLATYTESLFAFLALGCIYFSLHKKYIPAAIFAAFLTATHLTGLFVVGLMGLLLLDKKFGLVKTILTMIVGSSGLAMYMIYQDVHFHNAFAFVSAQKAHSWVNVGPSHLLSEFATLNAIFIILVLCAALYWWKRRRSFSIYSLLFLSILFVGGKGFSGFGRYTLMAFPIEFMIYDYCRNKKLAYSLALIFTAILWMFFTLRYAGGYTGG